MKVYQNAGRVKLLIYPKFGLQGVTWESNKIHRTVTDSNNVQPQLCIAGVISFYNVKYFLQISLKVSPDSAYPVLKCVLHIAVIVHGILTVPKSIQKF